MKPSERRAMQAQKQAEARERELEKLNGQRAQTEQAAERQEAKNTLPGVQQAADENVRGGAKGFLFRHAKLIAFLVTSVLIICVFSPFAVDRLLDSRENAGVVGNKKNLSIEAVYSIADNYGSITWKSFEKFNYTDMSRDDGTYFTREYFVDGSKFVLRVGGYDLDDVPEYIYLMSYADEDYVNLANGNVREFVKKYSKTEE